MGSQETHTNGHEKNQRLQIIRHPSYQPWTKFSLAWFDVRVFYVRISNFRVDDSTPQFLTLNHIPLTPNTLLELNGVRSSVKANGVSCRLKSDRVDKNSKEATFISTDGIRLNDSARFEVFNKDELLISGSLDMSHANGFTRESGNLTKRWSMNCELVMMTSTGFMGSESSFPVTVEVYVAGCFSGTPVVLTKTLQVNHVKRHKKGMLEMIPEASKSREEDSSGPDLQVAEYRNYKPETEEDYDNMYWRRTEYNEGEDGELSWFNAGVRVGVGIGLGICLGVGIGVGLLVRTYRTTTRNFKNRLG